MKGIVAMLVMTAVIGILAFWGAFTVNFGVHLARAGWQLAAQIF